MLLNIFRQTIEKVPYRDKGIFYSELYTFLLYCNIRKVDTLLESGSLYGFSTEFLARAFPGYIYSVDKQRLHDLDFPNLLFIHGDSIDEIPRLIKRNHHSTLGILIDGPKGKLGLMLKDECLKYNNVKVVGVHDAPMGSGETLHTHDPYWYQVLKELCLDESIKTGYEDKYQKGPGLGIWIQ